MLVYKIIVFCLLDVHCMYKLFLLYLQQQHSSSIGSVVFQIWIFMSVVEIPFGPIQNMILN